MSRTSSQDIEDIERAAAALSRFEFDVLVLSAGRGLSGRCIAKRLRVSERRVERALTRSIRKFDRALESGRRSKKHLL